MSYQDFSGHAPDDGQETAHIATPQSASCGSSASCPGISAPAPSSGSFQQPRRSPSLQADVESYLQDVAEAASTLLDDLLDAAVGITDANAGEFRDLLARLQPMLSELQTLRMCPPAPVERDSAPIYGIKTRGGML